MQVREGTQTSYLSPPDAHHQMTRPGPRSVHLVLSMPIWLWTCSTLSVIVARVRVMTTNNDKQLAEEGVRTV